MIDISAPSQAILRPSAMWITAEGLEARLTVGLPALGRRIAGHAILYAPRLRTLKAVSVS